MLYRKLAISAALAIVAGLGIATTGWAGADTANLSVSANVAQKCIISTTAVSFGTYDPVQTNASGGADATATGDINLTCTKGSGTPTAVTIGLSLGGYSADNSGSTGTSRAMKASGSTNYMDYELYQSTGTPPNTACAAAPGPYGTVWNTTNLLATTGTTWTALTAQAFKVCGVIPKGQDPVTDANYTDTVVATVNF
jgi:spore coat protein U domain-containing protein, fimbrial subunit CupE1/2/3/6